MTIINTHEAELQNSEHEHHRTQAVSQMIINRMAKILRELTAGRDLEQRLMGAARTAIAWLESTTYIMPHDYERICGLVRDAALTSGLMCPDDIINVGLMYDMMPQKDGFTREHQSNVVVRIQFSPKRV